MKSIMFTTERSMDNIQLYLHIDKNNLDRKSILCLSCSIISVFLFLFFFFVVKVIDSHCRFKYLTKLSVFDIICMHILTKKL